DRNYPGLRSPIALPTLPAPRSADSIRRKAAIGSTLNRDSPAIWRDLTCYRFVMPALVAGIHVLRFGKDVDARVKPAHDGAGPFTRAPDAWGRRSARAGRAHACRAGAGRGCRSARASPGSPR